MPVDGGAEREGLTAERVGSAPRRSLSGRFWHQGPTRYPLGSFADPASTDGRYHRRGGPGVWYASDREQAAWAELFRHFTDDGVGPFEVRRRVGAVDVAGFQVLDLTDERVRSSLGLLLEDLVGDEYSISQELAEAAAKAGFAGILAPSAAMVGRRMLVVFSTGMPSVVIGPSRVRQPPPRLADLMRLVRFRTDMPASVHSLLERVGQAGADLVRRGRRR